MLGKLVPILCWCALLVQGWYDENVVYHGAPVIVIADGDDGGCCGCYQQHQPVPLHPPSPDSSDISDESHGSEDDSYETKASDIIDDRQDELKSLREKIDSIRRAIDRLGEYASKNIGQIEEDMVEVQAQGRLVCVAHKN